MESRQVPAEVRDSLNELQLFDDNGLAGYFDRLADDHIESGTYATAADYIEAANRLRGHQITLARAGTLLGEAQGGVNPTPPQIAAARTILNDH